MVKKKKHQSYPSCSHKSSAYGSWNGCSWLNGVAWPNTFLLFGVLFKIWWLSNSDSVAREIKFDSLCMLCELCRFAYMYLPFPRFAYSVSHKQQLRRLKLPPPPVGSFFFQFSNLWHFSRHCFFNFQDIRVSTMGASME